MCWSEQLTGIELLLKKLPAGYADDVSRLNKTQVGEIWDIPGDPQKGEDQLRELL